MRLNAQPLKFNTVNRRRQERLQISKRRYYLSAHSLHGDVLLSNSAFLTFSVLHVLV